MKLHMFIVVVALALGPWRAAAVIAQDLHFTHGAAEGGQVRTNRTIFGLGEGSTYSPVPSSSLTVQLQPDDNDLFVFEFNAECRVTGGADDFFAVQARLNGVVAGIFGGSYLQPQDNPANARVCTAAEGSHTISKSWVIRLANSTSSPQTYTFSIWARTVDLDGLDAVIANLDNRIVRLTRYH